MVKRAVKLCLGAHMSVAGGLEKAVQLARDADCETVQIFTKNNNQWACKPLEDDQIERWLTALQTLNIVRPIAHTSYLINIASPDDALWSKSLDALIIEWQRAEQLGLDGLVLHPGAHTTSSPEEGMDRVVRAVCEAIEKVAPQRCSLLLENTAGQGSCLGHEISQLAYLIDNINAPQSVGVCLDTCHAFAAGYELNTKPGFKRMKTEISDLLPPGTIRALHLNDSKKGCGSRVDRHEHIGEGCIGNEGFRLVLKDPLFRTVPGYIETPKGTDEASGEDYDARNIRHLRALVTG